MQLNTQQQKAVDHQTGPLLIIAGAGTGKTAVITQRIVNIVKKEWARHRKSSRLHSLRKPPAK